MQWAAVRMIDVVSADPPHCNSHHQPISKLEIGEALLPIYIDHSVLKKRHGGF